MNKLLKNAVFVLLIILSINSAYAFNQNKLDELINKSEFNKTASIAVSIRNIDTENAVYQKDEKKLLHPASTLKLFTSYAALETLGYDYEFKTQFYKSGDDLYIKLGADPILSTEQLNAAFKKLRAENYTSFKNLYFDDSILDKKEIPAGWMQEDEASPYTPKISSYNLDGNVIKADLTPYENGETSINLSSKYPMSVINKIKTDNKNNFIEIERSNWNNPEVIELYGTVNQALLFNIPISSPRRYFIFNTEQALEENRIKVSGTRYASKLVPDNAVLLAEISNPVSAVMPLILKNSSNLPAETIYKLAASKKYDASGTEKLAGMMFEEFYNNMGADTSGIIIKDGSGVSRYNLLNAEWMADALVKLHKKENFEKFKENAAQPGEGTLADRLLELRGSARLKTGSLSNVSALAGYVMSKDGNEYALAVLIQNFMQNQSEIKQFEDEIIRIIYNK